MKTLFFYIIHFFFYIIHLFKNLFSKSKQFVETLQNENEPLEISEEVDDILSIKNPFERDFKIITKRPDNMSFEEYKRHLRLQKTWLKNRKKGFLVYCASEMLDMPNKDDITKTTKHLRTYRPFVGKGKVKYLKAI